MGKQGQTAGEEMLQTRVIELSQDPFVFTNKHLAVEFWDKIQLHADIITAGLMEQSSFLLETIIEIRLFQRRQEPGHCSWDAGLVNEIDMRLECGILIKPDDKSGGDFNAMGLDGVHGAEQI